MSEATATANGVFEVLFDGERGLATLRMQMQGRANKITPFFSTDLDQAIDIAQSFESIKGVIVASSHRDFCVGADLDMLYRADDAKSLKCIIKKLHASFRRLETLDVPVVAAITGSAMGGGYELALSCHHRIALSAPRIRIGLPEVSLGVIPGAGGTQRLPRLLGFQAALEHIAQGKILRPAAAKAVGFVDDLQDTESGVLAAAAAWIEANPQAKQPWDQKNFRWPPPAPGGHDARNLFMAACSMLYDKTAGAFSAPQMAIRAIYEGSGLNFDRAVEVEIRHFLSVAMSQQAKDMIRTFWYHRTAAEKHEGLPRLSANDVDGIGRIAVLGAGMMGAGLAFVCAKAGYDVILKDISTAALDKASAHLDTVLKKSTKALNDNERQAIRERVRPTLSVEELSGSSLVIEAIVENLELKHAVTRECEPYLAENAIWASNTSALPIGDLAQASSSPQRFIGLHFFSPVERMPLVEVVRGRETTDDTTARCLSLIRRIAKIPIVVDDGYGFYTTRTFSAYILEGAQMVAEGHAPPLIEWAARSAGMVVGPLQVFDEVSLTLVCHGFENSAKYQMGDFDLEGVHLVRRMVQDHNRGGKASGAGFYDYKDGCRVGLWPELSAQASHRPKPEESTMEQLGQRLLLIQCVEVARSLSDGVLRRARDAEVGAVFGIGFAPNTGGPLAYMDRLGIPKTIEQLEKFAAQYGKRYQPPENLKEMAEKGETFFGNAERYG